MIKTIINHKLENIGFYTLSNNRIEQQSHKSPLWRCELILTDQCNFKCPYCRGLRDDIKGTIPYDNAKKILNYWIDEKIKNVRFSGGEPTVYKNLLDLVKLAKNGGIERIAISSNGSADTKYYETLINNGVNDFSISLDACCSSFGEKMSGGYKSFDKIIENIKFISKSTYTTVGVVITQDNVGQLSEIVEFADSLGVHDIRIISAAQYNEILSQALKINDKVLSKYPILKYRINNIRRGRNVRGIQKQDTNKCHLVLDDMAIAGNYHFPCIIYMREGGDPIGNIFNNIREDRLKWFQKHDSKQDKICSKNCLDVCIDFNNKCEELK